MIVFHHGIDFSVPKAFVNVGVFAFPLCPVEVVAADNAVQTRSEVSIEVVHLVGIADAFRMFGFIEAFLQGVAEELWKVILLRLQWEDDAKSCYYDDCFFHDANYFMMSFWMQLPREV